MSYSDIIKRIKNGDRKAERLLFDLLSARLMHMCRRYTFDDSTAKDYFQESFIRIFEKLSKYDSHLGNFESWCFKVALNVILTNKRSFKRKIQINYMENLPDVDFEHCEMKYLSDEELLDCIRQLPSGYREVVNLFVFEQLSHKEIALLLDIKPSTSRSQYARAKNLLKKIMKNRIPDLYERKLA